MGDIEAHITIASHSLLVFGRYLSLVYLVFENAAEDFCRVRHSSFWTRQRANYLINGTWVVGIILWLSVIFGTNWHRKDYIHTIHAVLVYTDFVVVPILVTYLVLVFYRIHQSIVVFPTGDRFCAAHHPHNSVWRTFVTSKYS